MAKKQQPSDVFKTSLKRTSTNIGNLLSDNQPAKRIKNEHVGQVCDPNEPVLCTPIHILPNEILDEVFSYLSFKQRIKIEKVCKRWYWMGHQYKWQWPSCLCLYFARPRIATTAIEAILFRCGKRLKKLELFDGIVSEHVKWCRVKPAMEIIARYCPNLEYINIGPLEVPNLCLQHLAVKCPKLKSVCLHDSVTYTESGLMDFLELCQNLECLELSAPITGPCLAKVSSKLKILRLISIKLETVGLENVMNRCQHLCELRMSRCVIPPHILKTFLKKYKETLTILVLGEWFCNDHCNSSHLLQNIPLSQNGYRVDDELISFMARECRNLQHLSIYHDRLTDLGLSYLGSLPHLKVLDISGNSGVSAVGMKNVAKEGRLEELYASDISAKPNYFVQLARLCPNLCVVDMSSNSKISNIVVEAFYESIRSGFLKGPLKLFVGDTGVGVSTTQCDLLQLDFNPRRFYCGVLRNALFVDI